MADINEFEIQPSAAQTGDGASGEFDIPTLTMGAVMVDLTLASGTTPTLDLWLQQKGPDGNFYDVPVSLRRKTSTAGAEGTLEAKQMDARNINPDQITDADDPGRWLGLYSHLPGGTYKLRWAIGGTTPSFTFSAHFAGK